MISGYGSDDTVELNTGNAELEGDDTQDTSRIPGVVVDISAEPSDPAGANELGSSATGVDNLAGAAHQYMTGGSITRFAKGS
jgi:hypothetical protein